MRMKGKVTLHYFIATIAIFLFVLMGKESDFMIVGSAAKLDTQHFQQKIKPLNLKVTLLRTYLDGEVSEEVVGESVDSMQELQEKYALWQLVNIDQSTVIFRKNMDDISPLLKANGFFGITSEGVLSIFNGKPNQSKIIQSFFQIDIKKLESKKHEELIHGIPVISKNRYVEVLETFKPYSTEEKKRN